MGGLDCYGEVTGCKCNCTICTTPTNSMFNLGIKRQLININDDPCETLSMHCGCRLRIAESWITLRWHILTHFACDQHEGLITDFP